MQARSTNMKKTKLHSLIVWLVSLMVIGSFVYYLYINLEKYSELIRLSTIGLLSIFLITLLFPLINGLQNTLVYGELGANISFWDSLMITAASSLANQLPISGGIISKGIYLKKKFGLSYILFASSTVALFVYFVSASGFIGLIILAYWLLSGSLVFSLPLLTGYLVMALSFVLFSLPINYTHFPERIQVRLKQVVQGWKVLNRSPILLTRLVGLQTLLMVLLAFRYWIAFHMLSQNVTMSQALLFSTASILTQLVSVAPDGLGVRELIVSSVAGILGFDVGVGVLAVGIDHLVSTIVIFFAGWISVTILGKQVTQGTDEAD